MPTIQEKLSGDRRRALIEYNKASAERKSRVNQIAIKLIRTVIEPMFYEIHSAYPLVKKLRFYVGSNGSNSFRIRPSYKLRLDAANTPRLYVYEPWIIISGIKFEELWCTVINYTNSKKHQIIGRKIPFLRACMFTITLDD